MTRSESNHATIRIGRGVGHGPTELAAFDAALGDAGVANFNLLVLSSVIPPASTLERTPGSSMHVAGQWGDRLYVVLADHRQSHIGREAWAGIGWAQAGDGRGLFVEHHAESETQVVDDIERTLGAMTASRPEIFGPVDMQVVGARCESQPVCALAIAVFQSAPWSSR